MLIAPNYSALRPFMASLPTDGAEIKPCSYKRQSPIDFYDSLGFELREFSLFSSCFNAYFLSTSVKNVYALHLPLWPDTKSFFLGNCFIFLTFSSSPKKDVHIRFMSEISIVRKYCFACSTIGGKKSISMTLDSVSLSAYTCHAHAFHMLPSAQVPAP